MNNPNKIRIISLGVFTQFVYSDKAGLNAIAFVRAKTKFIKQKVERICLIRIKQRKM